MNEGGHIPGSEGLAFELVTELARFLALGPEWDAFFERVALPQQVFQSHVVLRHWARHYLDRAQRLSILVARQRGAIMMIWPLIRQRRFGLDTLAFMGMRLGLQHWRPALKQAARRLPPGLARHVAHWNIGPKD